MIYTCEYTGHVLDLGAFSRKRLVNRPSSGTVMGYGTMGSASRGGSVECILMVGRTSEHPVVLTRTVQNLAQV